MVKKSTVRVDITGDRIRKIKDEINKEILSKYLGYKRGYKIQPKYINLKKYKKSIVRICIELKTNIRT